MMCLKNVIVLREEVVEHLHLGTISLILDSAFMIVRAMSGYQLCVGLFFVISFAGSHLEMLKGTT